MASILDFGGAGDNATDNTPALNAALTALITGGDKTLHFPAGQFLFKSRPDPIGFGLHVIGEDIVETVLRKQFNGGTFFSFTGEHGSGGGISKAAIFADAGFSVSNAIVLSGVNGAHPEFARFEDLYVTGPGLWNMCFAALGNTILVPQGIREVSVSNCQFFNATAAAVWLANAVGFSMSGGGVYPGAGPASACGIWVTGGGTPGTNSNQATFSGVSNNGVLNITNSSGIKYLGGEIGSLATDVSSHCRIETQCAGAVINNLTNSVVSLN